MRHRAHVIAFTALGRTEDTGNDAKTSETLLYIFDARVLVGTGHGQLVEDSRARSDSDSEYRQLLTA